MTSRKILDALGPCGLSCERCFAHVDGDIRKHSSRLRRELGGFAVYARHFESLLGNPIFAKYPAFEEVLEHLASGSCRGCRHESCRLFESCRVRGCHRERGVDFCYECPEFPCDATGFGERLHARWVALNRHIRDVGIEQHYAETQTQSRYP